MVVLGIILLLCPINGQEGIHQLLHRKSKVKTSEDAKEVHQATAAPIEPTKEDSGGAISVDKVVTTEKDEASTIKKPTYPTLLEEPKGDRSLICRVGVRRPDGRRVQRNFLQILR